MTPEVIDVLGEIEVRDLLREKEMLKERLEAQVDERTAQMRKFDAALVLAEQRERQRIARVLHNHVQQLLHGLRLKIQFLGMNLSPEEQKEVLTKAGEATDEAIRITQGLATELSPPMLMGEGLEAALRWLALYLKDQYGLAVQFIPHSICRIGNEGMRALGREAHNLPLEQRLDRPEAPGEAATALERIAYRLRTLEGYARYGRRKSTVEAVFGQIKRGLGFRQFMLRGLARICGEWRLVTLAYTLRRLFQLRGRGAQGRFSFCA